MFTDFDIAPRENVKIYDVVEGVKFCTFLRKILKIDLPIIFPKTTQRV